MPPLNDEPALVDLLARGDVARRLAADIADCAPPYAFGVHGDWGAGKTSFLHQLQLRLTGKCPQRSEDEQRTASSALNAAEPTWAPADHLTVIWFEAWRYQNEEAPVVALLREIRAQLPWYAKGLAKAGKLSEVTVRSAFLVLEDLTKKIGIQAISRVQEVGVRWERDNLAAALPSHMIRQQLEHALSMLLGKGSGPRRSLVVMIDDLDRCSPEAAFKLLEGIKIYLNLPNCIFVLGMNQRIIENVIATRISGDPKVVVLQAREYLEKLCQRIVHLPVLRHPAQLVQSFLPPLAGVPEVVKVLDDNACLPSNPRRLKAYANLLASYLPALAPKFAAPPATAPSDAAHLAAIFTCLYQFHPDLYRVIEAHPRFYIEIRKWASQDKTAAPHEVFERLKVTLRAIDNPSSPTPTPSLVDAFADPAEGNVFRLQRLIKDFRVATETEVLDFLVHR